jgi:hypothetical protein
MRITLFKIGKPKQFKYIPRFYDQEKEEFEERKREIEREMGVGKDEVYHHNITKGSIARKIAKNKKRDRNSTIRVLVIVAIIILLFLYILR